MFIDASVIVAILKPEPDADAFMEKLESVTGKFYYSPLVKFEAAVALAQAYTKPTKAKAKPTKQMLATSQKAVEQFVQDLGAQEILISGEIGKLALQAAATYGKAVGHKADLNFGDCFSYACAKSYRVGLLYKGNDFAKTDLA